MFMYTYTGGAIYSQEDKYQKYDFEELAEGDYEAWRNISVRVPENMPFTSRDWT